MPGKPTGSRPTPKLPPLSGKTKPQQMNKVKAPIKHTPMPSPKKAATNKKKGGRGY